MTCSIRVHETCTALYLYCEDAIEEKDTQICDNFTIDRQVTCENGERRDELKCCDGTKGLK